MKFDINTNVLMNVTLSILELAEGGNELGVFALGASVIDLNLGMHA